MPFAQIMTRIEGKKHDDLMYDFDENTFPTFLVLSETGELLARHRELPTVAEFKLTIEKVKKTIALRKQKDGGGAALALLECELIKMDFADLEEKVEEGMKLTDEQKKTYKALAADSEVAEMTGLIVRNRYRPAMLADAGDTFIDHLKAGSIPLGRKNAFHYWLGIGYYAWDKKDKELSARALKMIEPGAKASKFFKMLRDEFAKKAGAQ